MKITRLSSTDVANISVLPRSKKREALFGIEQPSVRWGYDPVKNALPSLLLASSPLFGALPGGDEEELVQSIERAARSGPQQKKAVGAVARAIITWRNKNSVTGRVISPEPLRMSVDTIHFCADVAAVINDELYIINLDCRSSMHLTTHGKEFMKSLIHHTARIGDLRAARVGILRTPRQSNGTRLANMEVLEGEPLFSLDEIMGMVTETYVEWELILRSRRSGKASEA